MVQTEKNQPAVWETQVQSLGQEDPLEKGMATHSMAILQLPGEFHGQRNLAGYPSMGMQRVGRLTLTSGRVMPLGLDSTLAVETL